MKKQRNILPCIAVLIGIIFLLGGCGNSKKNSAEITVFCCAGLTEVMSIMADSFMVNNDIEIHLNFASSGILARQLKNGAPANIYVSASTDWINYCIENNVADTAAIVPFLQNSLVWVAPISSNATSIAAIEHITATQKIAIGDPAHVPVGKYAQEYLKNVGLWSKLESAFIPCRDVKNTLFMVEHAEVEFGLVYYTDAVRSKKVKIIEIVPDSLHTPIELSMILLDKKKETADFFAYLMLNSNKAVYTEFGFKNLIE